ncbi:BatD family protein [Elizabethkingia sp. JS20170427COW]|uniref:BatD family protein n=1 Tax=Elizabethkingia sp. JS20170427COW TaxID=2583851 RepID=UPI0011103021|nr:BatD family protein [Elizabethkingia sp. JS20170427COW]QCX53935.1 protein BatD [Elizabethkingia sp. JS20170427COW]
MKQWYFYILFFIFSLKLSAQVEMKSFIEERNIKIGQEVPIYAVCTSNQDFQIKLPPFDPNKLELVDFQTNKSTFINDNGTLDVRLEILVLVRPKVPGSIKLGSFLASQGSKIYKTDAFDISVRNERVADNRNPYRNNDIHIKSNLSRNNIYPDQGSFLVVTAHSRNVNSLNNIQEVQVPKMQGIATHQVSGINNEVHESDEDYYTKIAVYYVFPQHSGNFHIPPVTAKVAQGGNVSKVKSNPVDLHVKPLPEVTVPGFSNAVGQYKLEMGLKSQKDIELDKPINVVVKLSGVGNLRDVKLPSFTNETDFQTYKPKISYHLKPTKNGYKGEVLAEYVIVPKKQGNISLSLQDFSYFDPVSKDYVALKTQDISLLVQPKSEGDSGKTAVEKVVNNTADVLNKKINLPVIAQIDAQNNLASPQSDSVPIWLLILAFIFIAVFIYFVSKTVNSNKAKTPQGRHYSPHFKHEETVETVSETEEKIKEEQAFDMKINLDYLGKLAHEAQYDEFFVAYEELNQELEKHLQQKYSKNLSNYIEENFDYIFNQNFKNIKNKYQILKFSPFKEEDTLLDFYQEIILLYPKIVE